MSDDLNHPINQLSDATLILIKVGARTILESGDPKMPPDLREKLFEIANAPTCEELRKIVPR